MQCNGYAGAKLNNHTTTRAGPALTAGGLTHILLSTGMCSVQFTWDN